MHCAVCGQSESVEWFEFYGDDEVSVPRTWVLCASCTQAVRRELERTQLRSPARVRVAIAMVASSMPMALSPPTQMNARMIGWSAWLIATVLAAFLVHALAFVLVIAFIAASH